MEVGGESNIFNKEAQDSMFSHEEVWDDTLLIKQYDAAMNEARSMLASQLSSATESEHSQNQFFNDQPLEMRHSKIKKKRKSRKKNEWHIGNHCSAKYNGDSQYYEATIVDLSQSNGTCTVRFLGYDDHASLPISSLLKSRGDAERKKQLKEVTEASQNNGSTCDDESITESFQSEKSKDSHIRNSGIPKQLPIPSPRSPRSVPDVEQMSFLPRFAPPPPLIGVTDEDSSTNDAMHTMLISWYMAGYNTGYYEGLKQGKAESEKTKHRRHRRE